MTTYRFRDTAHFPAGVRGSAQAIGERLEALRAEGNGVLKPEAVVDDARRKGSLLHPLFEWDDTRAADQYRLTQARYLVGAVVVSYEEAPDAGPVRAFVTLTGEEEGQHYRSTRDAMLEPGMRAQVLAAALRELGRIRDKYGALVELAAVFAALDHVKNSAEKAA